MKTQPILTTCSSDKFDELYFLKFAHTLAQQIFNEVIAYYDYKLVNGLTEIEFADYKKNSGHIKSEHKVDKFVKDIIKKYIEEKYPQLLSIADIYIEDMAKPKHNPRKLCLYFDPIDGSRSADLNIGDPCFMVAYAEKSNSFDKVKFKDLKGCFIKCLKTGDTYFTYRNKSYYIPSGHSYDLLPDGTVLLDDNLFIKPLQAKKDDNFKLSQSTVVVRDGYGMRKVVSEKIDHTILNSVYHNFCHDITGTELCYMAAGRDIIHVLIEARKHIVDNKTIGSDGYNLIPYPLLKAAGGMIYTLDGMELETIIYNPTDIYDFIACTSKNLLNEFLANGIKKAPVLMT